MEHQENIIGVYKITNIKSGRYYIGYSKHIIRRFYKHKSQLRSKCHENIFLQRAYNLDGEDSFIFDIIHKCNTEEEAKEIELTYLTNMDIREQLYNLNYNNSGGDLLSNHPNKDAIREKIISSCKETISKISVEERKLKYGKLGEKNGMYGKTHSEKNKKIFSDTHKGNSHRTGKKASEKTKKTLSEVAKLRIGEKNHFYGRHHTEETKQKLREKGYSRISKKSIKIIIDNKEYISMTEASRQLNIPIPTILWRLKSKNPKFDSYKYVENSMQPFQP